MGSTIRQAEYGNFLNEIKVRIRAAQYEALKAVNKQLISLYWDIGRMIVDRQDKLGWGKSVVQTLAADLHKEFPGARGYSTQNLWYMRQFYKEYASSEKLQSLVGEIGWAHNLVIMSKIKDPFEREFYIRMTRRMGWSKNVLVHMQDNSQTAERTEEGASRPSPAPGLNQGYLNADSPSVLSQR